MDMDMEMPDPDELEWMESHGLVPEEEDTYFDDPDEGFVLAPGDSDQPCNSPQPQESAAPRASMQCTPFLVY
jgi:chromosome transmission fidelity protein 18